MTGSNTRQFTQRGWRALLIEPSSIGFAVLTEETRELPGVTCIQSFVTRIELAGC